MVKFNGTSTTPYQMTLLEAFNHIKYFADNYCNGNIAKAVEQLQLSIDYITDDSKEALNQYKEWQQRMIAWNKYVNGN
jgi:hypothetical protein